MKWPRDHRDLNSNPTLPLTNCNLVQLPSCAPASVSLSVKWRMNGNISRARSQEIAELSTEADVQWTGLPVHPGHVRLPSLATAPAVWRPPQGKATLEWGCPAGGPGDQRGLWDPRRVPAPAPADSGITTKTGAETGLVPAAWPLGSPGQVTKGQEAEILSLVGAWLVV